MPKFSKASMSKLLTCSDQLQKLFLEVIKYYDCTITEGFRDEATQNKYYNEGKSKVKWPNGQHNKMPSMAVDVAPCIDGKLTYDTNQCYNFAGFVLGVAAMMSIPIRWGGDWDGDRNIKDQTFNDLVHFELK
jgi:peptidoglycan LD-endopeptidase CwlK